MMMLHLARLGKRRSIQLLFLQALAILYTVSHPYQVTLHNAATHLEYISDIAYAKLLGGRRRAQRAKMPAESPV